jgi:hypothetical protein
MIIATILAHAIFAERARNVVVGASAIEGKRASIRGGVHAVFPSGGLSEGLEYLHAMFPGIEKRAGRQRLAAREKPRKHVFVCFRARGMRRAIRES